MGFEESYTCEAEIVYGKNIENNIYDYAENHNRHRCHLRTKMVVGGNLYRWTRLF